MKNVVNNRMDASMGVGELSSNGGQAPMKPEVVARSLSAVVSISLLLTAGCPVNPSGDNPINPFRDLPAVRLDGEAQELKTTIAPLGSFDKGDVVRIQVDGEDGAIEAVLILREDAEFDEAGVVVGGGRPGTVFDYRIPEAGAYFVFVQFSGDAEGHPRRAELTAMMGDASFRPPAGQTVVVSFEQDFLTDPGLFDPVDGTGQEQSLLASISDDVRDGIVGRLRTIFEGTPIDIVDERDGLPTGPYSRVTFSPRREPANESEFSIDAVLPPDAAGAECDNDAVVFGEVLPRGATLDPGNQLPDDQAVVYVGSFQGRGAACRTSAIESVNNIILGLSQTAAHEIGHLVGLYHGALVDIMSRSPSLAFQRELGFARQQILVEQPVTVAGEMQVQTVVLTNVFQDPAVYFESVFDAGQ